MKLLLQRDVSWTKDTNAVDRRVASAWENLKAELTREQHKVSHTVEHFLNLSGEAVVSRGELQKCWTTVEGEVAKVVKGCEILKTKIRDDKLKSKLMKGWEKKVTEVD